MTLAGRSLSGICESVNRHESQAWCRALRVSIGLLAEIAQRAKGHSNWLKYQQVLDLVDRFLAIADGDLPNAIHVSFLEHLDFIGPRGAQAWKLLTPRLQSAWKDIITYNEELLGRSWPQDKVKPWLTKPESES